VDQRRRLRVYREADFAVGMLVDEQPDVVLPVGELRVLAGVPEEPDEVGVLAFVMVGEQPVRRVARVREDGDDVVGRGLNDQVGGRPGDADEPGTGNPDQIDKEPTNRVVV
jgi:hypothetical protein